MKKLVFLLVVCGYVYCHGQTNVSSAPLSLFSDRAKLSLELSPPEARPTSPVMASADFEDSGTETNADSIPSLPVPSLPSSESNTNSFSRDLGLGGLESDFHRQIYRRLEEGGYLRRAEEPSENLLVRATDAIFLPEVVRIGKVSVSCSVITAIKRKNPLCLINPIFFNASW